MTDWEQEMQELKHKYSIIQILYYTNTLLYKCNLEH